MQILLLSVHLPQKGGDRQGYRKHGVARKHADVQKGLRTAAGDESPLKLDGVYKGQRIGDVTERTADKLKVKPYAGEPRCKVREQRTAYASDLLYGEQAAA